MVVSRPCVASFGAIGYFWGQHSMLITSNLHAAWIKSCKTVFPKYHAWEVRKTQVLDAYRRNVLKQRTPSSKV